MPQLLLMGDMAGSVSKKCMTSLVVFLLFISTSSLSPTSHNHLLSCSPEEEATSTSSYVCHSSLQKCHTFAVLRANSLPNHVHLGLDADEFVPPQGHQLLFIPIDCRCNGRIYEAHLFKTCVKGDTFRSVSASLQGLTTCLSIREKNPQVSEDSLDESVTLRLAVRCSCPEEGVSNARFLVTYPVSDVDSVSSLAVTFNTTEDAIVSANNKSGVLPLRPALIPLDHKPVLHPLPKPGKPVSQNTTIENRRKRKRSKMKLMISVSSAIAGVCGLITLMVFGYLHWKKETRLQTQNWISNKDPETRQLSLSIRTTSDKKISFEGSQDGSILDSQNAVGTTTPRKPPLEIYAFQELEKATENFSSTNHIKGSVYFGSLKGKDLAIKQVSADAMKRFDFGLLNDQSHYHNHNLIRVLGTCFRETGQEGSYLVFEYAKNGSLWDWLQNKLAIKNQFIESCYCFLAWKQRIKICHDVAIALKYMHRINYVHGNIKSRNIFLNEDLRGKVGNFGMSKCAGDELATEENILEGSMSAATDVFAYGIIVMEVLSGHTPEMLLETQEQEISLGTQESCLPEWKRLRTVLGKKEMLKEVMDSTLGESYSVDSAFEIARIARDCTAEEPELRPSAAEIAERVSRLVDDNEEDEDEAVIERGNTLISESSYKPLVKKNSSIDE
ncbi:hypothetical protein EUTSA_v10020217mg [Eutrema salsugineum]|uniref:Protein kinase domain-containing protein n=1 Tax=Eutrema salsugineum TaxID=72664 RepID=V4LHP0_EUTSA|nr:protein LYK2 [Eutrema salsugineum]ESQ50005.1 hypothetical protein EUTSA_v10020217mg [Eutrema salsugineum]